MSAVNGQGSADATTRTPRSLAVATMVIALLAMLGPFSIDTMFPAFDLIGRDLSADSTAMQQVTSTYMLAFAVMCLFHGPLSDAIGRKPVIIGSLVVYALATVVCAIAASLPMLLVGRALQGLAAGGSMIIARTMIRDLHAGPAAQRMMSQVNMIFSVAPAAAPVVGGVILVFGTWQWIFWFLLALAVVMILAAGLGLPETHPVEARRPLQVGSILLSLGQVLRQPQFLRLAAVSTFGFAAQFLYIVAAPIILLRLLGKGEQDFWLLFVPMVAGMMLGAYVSSRLAAIVPQPRLVAIGMAIVLVAVALNVVVASFTRSLPWALMGPPLIAFGIQLVFPILQLLMLDRFPTMRGAASSGGAFLQLSFNAVLSGLIAPLVSRSMLGIALTSAGFAVLATLFWAWFSYVDRRELR